MIELRIGGLYECWRAGQHSIRRIDVLDDARGMLRYRKVYPDGSVGQRITCAVGWFAESVKREALAQAGEARRAETALAGSVHEHAVGEADAP